MCKILNGGIYKTSLKNREIKVVREEHVLYDSIYMKCLKQAKL